MTRSQHVFGTFRFLQLHFGKAEEPCHILTEACWSQEQDNKWHKESVALNSVQWDCHRMKEARELTACADVLPVNSKVVVDEQDLSQRKQGMMKDKQSWGRCCTS